MDDLLQVLVSVVAAMVAGGVTGWIVVTKKLNKLQAGRDGYQATTHFTAGDATGGGRIYGPAATHDEHFGDRYVHGAGSVHAEGPGSQAAGRDINQHRYR